MATVIRSLGIAGIGGYPLGVEVAVHGISVVCRINPSSIR